MKFTPFTSISLLFFCCLWHVKSRLLRSRITVDNGGYWGDWGRYQYCMSGYANGFRLKVQPPPGFRRDDTSLNGIALKCPDGSEITSTVGPEGSWTAELSCKPEYLVQFWLRASPHIAYQDDTAANDITFSCSNMTRLQGLGRSSGYFGDWSDRCMGGGICGLRTRVQKPIYVDNSGLNDVEFACCDDV